MAVIAGIAKEHIAAIGSHRHDPESRRHGVVLHGDIKATTSGKERSTVPLIQLARFKPGFELASIRKNALHCDRWSMAEPLSSTPTFRAWHRAA